MSNRYPTIAVCAGTFEQFAQHHRDHCDGDTAYEYVRDLNSLYGAAVVGVVHTGTFWERQDATILHDHAVRRMMV